MKYIILNITCFLVNQNYFEQQHDFFCVGFSSWVVVLQPHAQFVGCDSDWLLQLVEEDSTGTLGLITGSGWGSGRFVCSDDILYK